LDICPKTGTLKLALYRVEFSLRYLTFIFVCSLLSACAGNAPSCRRDLTPVWADIAALTQDVDSLSSDAFAGRKTQSHGAELTRAYLSQRFAGLGLQPWPPLTRYSQSGQDQDYAVPFEYDLGFSTRQGINLVGVIPAREPSRHWRIIMAHYDHLGTLGNKTFQGADDNASGVAALLQLAAHAHARPELIPANINLMFVATDAEEPGLFGSTALVPQLKAAMADARIELALNLDMIGHPSRPYAVYLEGSRNFNHFDLIQPRLNAANGLCIRLSHPRPQGRSAPRIDWLRASDHYPFHRAGIPWLYFGVPPHAQYHTVEDKIERIDFPFLAAVTESAFELLTLDSDLLRN
jgi:hypothetical protein